MNMNPTKFKEYITKLGIPFEEDIDDKTLLSVSEEDLEPYYQELMNEFPDFKPFRQHLREDAEPKRIGD